MNRGWRCGAIVLLVVFGPLSFACRPKSPVDEIAGSWRLDRDATLADPAVRKLSVARKRVVQKKIEALEGLTFIYSPDEVRAEYRLADGKTQTTGKKIVRSLKDPSGEIVIETRNERGGVDRIRLRPITPDHFSLPVLNNPELKGIRLHFFRL